MKKIEVMNFIKKIKAYYPVFRLEDEAIDEWIERLKPYSNEDILRKFEEHLNGEYALEPPKLHFLTKFLKTEEEKARVQTDYLIRCNLCGQEMPLSIYEGPHFKKCLLIKALIPVLKEKGDDVDYEELDKHSFETLEKVWDKYMPLEKNFDIGRSSRRINQDSD